MRPVPLIVIAAVAPASLAQITASYAQPTFDRWNYPFNTATPLGSEPGASTFSSGFVPGMFDDRDGQFLTSWVTAGDVTPGLGASKYVITRATMTATTLANDDRLIAYDPTLDQTETYRDPSQPGYVADADAGRPMELFGTGFRNGLNAFAYGDSMAFAFGDPTQEDVRNAYAAGHDAGGSLIDVSNSVRDGFTPTPFAIGTLDTFAAGDLIPASSTFTFELNVADANVQAYLAEAMHEGILSLTVAPMYLAAQPGPDPQITYPRFQTAESLSGAAPTLVLEVTIIPTPGAAGVLAGVGLMAARRRR